jgi:two-component system chemotaxis sensor kinase CheA
MTTMDMSKYKDLFISEAREHVQGMNTCILVLEKEPGSDESINELFRHAHSVKGMSASMGYGTIAELSHQLEDMMDGVRKGQTTISPPIIDILLDGMDNLDKLVDAVEQDGDLDELLTASLLSRIKEVIEGNTPAPESPAEPQPEPEPEPVPETGSVSESALGDKGEDPPPEAPLSTEPVDDAEGGITLSFQIADDSLVPAARAYLAVRKLESLGTIVRCQPSLEEIKSGNYPGKVTVTLTGADEEQVINTLQSLAEMGDVNLSVPAAKKRGTAAASGSPAATDTPGDVPGDIAAAPSVAPSAIKKEPSAASPAAAKTVRISTLLLDTFINLVGELIVTKGRLNDLLTDTDSREVDQVLTRLDHLVGSLHSEVMKVRMMPLETVTQRLPRVVRDLARQRGKQVRLEVIGADIELDRAILEELGDPLIHILRNAVDHGLEDTKERAAAGKDETGRIILRAYRERDMVYVEVIDDGRGMDLHRIKAKAVEKGILSRDQAKVISDEETVMLVSRPGFSTATEVTDVSGRGVGMDVVQSTVEGFGGSLSIDSNTGEGTTFTLRLPLTVAIVKMLLVSLRDHTFAVPITRVARTIRITDSDVSESQGRRYLDLDEDLVSLFDLGQLLEIEQSMNGRSVYNVVLVEATNRVVGLVVDSVVGQVDIVVKPLCYPIQYLKRYSGMTVLGDGRIVPILDLGNLF